MSRAASVSWAKGPLAALVLALVSTGGCGSNPVTNPPVEDMAASSSDDLAGVDQTAAASQDLVGADLVVPPGQDLTGTGDLAGSCGSAGAPCCTGNVCNGTNITCRNGTCVLCGNLGQQCCPG